jgi:hypothetical protein
MKSKKCDKISACMIVKNSSDTLDITMKWALDNFEEICIVADVLHFDDTIDKLDDWELRHPDTIKLMYREFDDFSSQMNVCLEMATKEYTCITSSDEIMEEVQWDGIIKLMTDKSIDVIGFHRFNLQYDIYHVIPIGYPDMQVRMFKTSKNIRMNGKVVDESLDFSNCRLMVLPFHIIHFGHIRNEECLLQKGRDREIFANDDAADGAGLKKHGDKWFVERNNEWDEFKRPLERHYVNAILEYLDEDSSFLQARVESNEEH